MTNHLKEIPTKVYYLKMDKKPFFKGSTVQTPTFSFSKLPTPISTETYLFYYRSVGQNYNWLDRLSMKTDALYDVINSPRTEIFIYYISKKPAGFAEFIRENNYTEILYFGLLPDYIGKGVGKHFMLTVINEAWNNKSQWIQLNTCDLDHPNALPTYKKSGFKLDKTVIENRKVLIKK